MSNSNRYKDFYQVHLSSYAESFFGESKTLAMQNACHYILDHAQESIAKDPNDQIAIKNYNTIMDYIRDGEYEDAIEYWDDDYNITRHALCVQVADFAFNNSSTSKQAASSPNMIDDHTCIQCKNTACSKTEKSCWRCGHPIS